MPKAEQGITRASIFMEAQVLIWLKTVGTYQFEILCYRILVMVVVS